MAHETQQGIARPWLTIAHGGGRNDSLGYQPLFAVANSMPTDDNAGVIPDGRKPVLSGMGGTLLKDLFFDVNITNIIVAQ